MPAGNGLVAMDGASKVVADPSELELEAMRVLQVLRGDPEFSASDWNLLLWLRSQQKSDMEKDALADFEARETQRVKETGR